MPESKTSLDGYSIPEVLRGENSKIKTKENLDVKAKTKVQQEPKDITSS